MYAEFHDERADQMRALAKSVGSPTERFAAKSDSLAKAGPIVSQFFSQPEVNLQPLSTDKLVDSMAGSEDARRARFKAMLMSMYPTNSRMWVLEPPTAAGASVGSTGSSKARGAALLESAAAALQRLEAAKALKLAVDGGSGGLYAEAFENARRVQATW